MSVFPGILLLHLLPSVSVLLISPTLRNVDAASCTMEMDRDPILFTAVTFLITAVLIGS